MLAKQNSSSDSSLRRILLFLFAGLFALCLPTSGRADALEEAARSLARKVAAAPRVFGRLRVEWSNRSSLPEVQSGSLRNAFEQELRSGGVLLEDSTGAAGTLAVTIAETATDVRLVAWITASQLPAVRIVSVPRHSTASALTSAPRLSLEKRLLLRQAEPILDVAMLGNFSANQSLLILEASKLVLYRWQSDRWESADAAQIPRLNPWPRDIRGEILDPERNLEIRLSGLLCKGTAKEKVFLDCGQKPDPDGLTPGRNYYPAGRSAADGEKGPPYFAGTDAQDGSSHLELVSGTDGRMYVFRGEGGRVTATFSGWGNDMASLDTECGSKRQVLATRASDWTVPDAIQAYEIHGDRPEAVGSPLEFSGPVMSLHRTADLRAVMAIVRNAETGIYEAYRITLACGN